MIFLESYFDKGYLTKVLLKTNPKDILLLNCMEEKASSFVQFLSKNFENVSTTEASCDIEQSDLEIFLKQERALVVLLTESKNFSHQAALRVADRKSVV